MKRQRVEPLKPPPRRPDSSVEIFNVKLPLSRPLSALLTGFLLICAVMSGTASIVNVIRETKTPGVVVSGVQREYDEIQRHLEDEKPARRLFPDTSTSLIVSAYTSDGCIVVEREASGLRTTRLLRDPTRGGSAPPTAAVRWPRQEITGAGVAMAKRCNGNCLNRHSGKYDSSWSDKSDCWIKSWRRYEDGCEGFQWYNHCQGSWDREFHWTCCVH